MLEQLPLIVVGASGLLAGSALGSLWWRVPPRLRRAGRDALSGRTDRPQPPDGPEARPESAAGVPAHAAGVPAHPAGVPAAVPGRGAGESGALVVARDQDGDPTRASGRRAAGVSDAQTPSRARVFMSNTAQVAELIAWMVAEGYARQAGAVDVRAGRYSDKVWLSEYHAWAARLGVVVMPPSIFLAVLGKHPLITKSRDRVKNPRTGAVIKNAAGTAVREYNYALAEAPPVIATMTTDSGRRKRVAVPAADINRLRRAA